MRTPGAELTEHDDEFQSALEYCRQLAAKQGLYAMPSMDSALVRGVATYALEFPRREPPHDAVCFPIGMAPGIGGVIAAGDALGLRTRKSRRGQRVGIILSSRTVDRDQFARVLAATQSSGP